MPDPTPAEIDTGIAAVPRAAVPPSWRFAVVDNVLRAVLPDHDARIRAEERDRLVDGLVCLGLLAPPAAIARAHATPPEETDHA